jgi:hypothetical protein
MANRKIDARRVKIHRNYEISEAAKLLGVHKNSLQNWFKSGLARIDDKRPILIHGSELRRFLDQRRNQFKITCGPGQLFCLKCRAPRHPCGGLVDYVPITLVSGNLKAICEVCDTFMFRRVALLKIDTVTVGCEVAFPQGQQRITDKS